MKAVGLGFSPSHPGSRNRLFMSTAFKECQEKAVKACTAEVDDVNKNVFTISFDKGRGYQGIRFAHVALLNSVSDVLARFCNVFRVGVCAVQGRQLACHLRRWFRRTRAMEQRPKQQGHRRCLKIRGTGLDATEAMLEVSQTTEVLQPMDRVVAVNGEKGSAEEALFLGEGVSGFRMCIGVYAVDRYMMGTCCFDGFAMSARTFWA